MKRAAAILKPRIMPKDLVRRFISNSRRTFLRPLLTCADVGACLTCDHYHAVCNSVAGRCLAYFVRSPTGGPLSTALPIRSITMTRYKGRPSAQSIARDFPHVVEIAMPAGGLGKRLDAMHEFHARRGIRARNGPHRRHN